MSQTLSRRERALIQHAIRRTKRQAVQDFVDNTFIEVHAGPRLGQPLHVMMRVRLSELEMYNILEGLPVYTITLVRPFKPKANAHETPRA